MANTSWQDIRAALEAQLLTIAGISNTGTGKNVAWENKKFTPANNALWVQPQLLPAIEARAGIGTSAPQRIDGKWQVNVYAPQGTGPATADQMADAIRDAYPPGTVLSAGNKYIRIQASARYPGFNSTPWYQVPVEVTWYTYFNEEND